MDHKKAVEEAFAELAPRYEKVMDAELRRFWGWSYDYFVNQLLDITTINDHDIVLDIATGTGVIPRRLCEARSNGNRYIGLDITPGMLRQANQKIDTKRYRNNIRLTCASAMEMPFRDDTFHQITCGLATHHMDVTRLISEMIRVLQPGGRITIADVGASRAWKFLPFRMLVRIVAFLIYLPGEGFARAWAEAAGVSNMLTAEDWKNMLARQGFLNIKVNKLESRRFWMPAAIALQAVKQSGTEIRDYVNSH